MVVDQTKPGTEHIICHFDKRFVKNHARVIQRLKLAGAVNVEEKFPDNDEDGELHTDQILMAERVTIARPCCSIKMGDVIERIIASDHLERLVLQPT